MKGKKYSLFILTLVALVFLSAGCSLKQKVVDSEPTFSNQKVVAQKNIQTPAQVVKKYDLYSTTTYDLPLSSIVEISKLPIEVKNVVDNLLEKSLGFYLLKNNGDKVLVVLQNPVQEYDTFSRQDLQFAEIDMKGNVIYHNAGYVGIQGEIKNADIDNNDSWVFDNEPEQNLRPIKHIAYDEKGKAKFTEIWNYNEEEPIKYQMKDAHKKVVSILKESHDNDLNYRKEHIFYDNEGNTKMSLTVNYEGANISRLMFYNSHDSIDSMSILSEYNDGIKIKELVYNEDYQLISTIVPEYVNGERKKIRVLDSQGNEIYQISS